MKKLLIIFMLVTSGTVSGATTVEFLPYDSNSVNVREYNGLYAQSNSGMSLLWDKNKKTLGIDFTKLAKEVQGIRSLLCKNGKGTKYRMWVIAKSDASLKFVSFCVEGGMEIEINCSDI